VSILQYPKFPIAVSILTPLLVSYNCRRQQKDNTNSKIFNLQVIMSLVEIHGHKTEQSSSLCHADGLLLSTSQNLARSYQAVFLSPVVNQLNTQCSSMTIGTNSFHISLAYRPPASEQQQKISTTATGNQAWWRTTFNHSAKPLSTLSTIWFINCNNYI